MDTTLKIALAGNPNCGKSTLFNALTGSHQHVGNGPGKTVEKKSGSFRSQGQTIEVVDLPGTYSLSPFSQEEVIARDYILGQHPDAVVSVVDGSNLERNLYLTSQLLELGKPVVLSLNMMDIAASRGIRIDSEALSFALGIPVVPMVASEGKGISGLAERLLRLVGGNRPVESCCGPNGTEKEIQPLSFGKEIDSEISALEKRIRRTASVQDIYPSRWLAVKLLEQDREVIERVGTLPEGGALLTATEESLARIQPALPDGDFESFVADRRYTYINNLVRIVSQRAWDERVTTSDKIDKIVTHRFLGIPIFLALMWFVFKLTTDVAAPFMDWVDGVITGPLTNWIMALLNLAGLGGTWVESLFLDGAIAGVGSVMVFVPVLMSLYLALAVLEDSGYMARAAFVMDRLMRSLGLHGKSFLPMIVGFGCTVPALYATRTLENEKDRILTGLLVPFMSCGARLPVYVLLGAVFFPQHTGLVIFGLYLLGIVIAILLGIILRHTVFKNSERAPFVMELPPYRLPTLRGIWMHMWERTGAFIRKAWTIILATSLLVWLVMAIPLSGGEFSEVPAGQSAFAGISGITAPIFAPAGFGSWEASGALVTGFVAKEVVISTLAQAYGLDEEAAPEEEAAPAPTFTEDMIGIVGGFGTAAMDALKALPGLVGINLAEAEEEEGDSALMQTIEGGFERTSGGHGGLAAIAYMVFVLLYTPCMVAIAAERQELGMKWTWVSIFGQLAIAWAVAVLIFQVGSRIGLG